MEWDKGKVISHFSDESSLGFGEWLLVDIESDSHVYYYERSLAFGYSRPLAHVKATYFEGAVGGLSALVGSRRRRSKADGDGDIESDSHVYYNERNEGGLLEATPEVAEYVCTAAACTTTAAGTTATSVTAATMAVTAAVPGTFVAR
jgi:hypothetical protein